MSHDTHDHHHHDHHHDNHNEKPVVQFKTGIIFPLMLIGLFLASIAFVQSMNHSESGHGEAHANQHHEATHGAAQQANKNHTEQQNDAVPAAEHHNAAGSGEAHQENHH